MGLLDDAIADRDAAAFVDPDVFGEAVVYTPRGGSPVTIYAVVTRDPPEERNGAPNARRPKMLVSIRNHATAGRASINAGGDTITVAYRKGGTPQAFAVTGPVRQDAGLWVLELS